IQYLFEKNGIEIPEDASFRLTVDSSYTIHVTGLEDKKLAKSIEQALNSGDNGKNLYDLLKITSPDKHVLHEDNYNYLQVTARNTEALSIGYSCGRLEAVDTSRELSEDSLAEAENQVGLSYFQFCPEPYLNSKLLGWVGPDVPPYEAARLESQFRLGCPRLSAQIHAGLFPPMSLEEIAKNSDIDPKGEIARNTYLDVISQYQTSARETVADYYAAAHRENSSYALPDAIRHIEEKYRVMESAIFRFDLPPAQREMYYRQEMALLLGNPLTLYDPYALASTGGILTSEELRSRAVQAVRDKLAALRAQKEQ
ncbi:MAG: DUF4885 domain-containing protein, partial [Oscillospiraceae bacterium]|nr:DUF4885 domain-containing protein [Oscillospiraceae bacterium]